MNTKLLSPMLDLVFKRIFGDPRNADILANLLLSILKLPEDEYAGLEFVDTNTKLAMDDGKIAILDVKVKTKSGKVLDIEMQILQTQAMRERIVFYLANLIVEQLSRGQDYGEIKPVIVIVISGYPMIDEETDYHNAYNINNMASHRPFTDLLEIHTVELGKLSAEGDGSALSGWMRFLRAEDEEEFTMAAEANPMIQKAYGVLAELSADEKMRIDAAAREKALKDYNSFLNAATRTGLAEGLAKGLAEGLAEGLAKGKVEAARKMKEEGLSSEQIKRITGLSAEAIAKL
jgi:predicted transposase/invertase (TIGR01784 family)